MGAASRRQTCALSADAGAVDAVSTVIATGDVENVVTAMACPPRGSTIGNANNPNAIDKYSQGYSYADPTILAQVEATMQTSPSQTSRSR